ncbi:hypothetical protein V757_12750 [Pelistega indica]|uniref:Transposase n=1 Tax=Pelistega indica TaxID=1414851 RepID=V8FPX5_9BURK|nr:hypothetical protein [Pelistega indica]ETD66349.1 hypothetical protein V757_12750 [Pelistega indica]
MARLARLYAPNTCQLVQAKLLPHIARLSDEQQLKPKLLAWLEELSVRYQLPIHAWSITNEGIYFLSTPPNERTISQVVQALGRYLASSLRLGAVFASRYRSCLVEEGDHYLACMIWLEMYLHHKEGIEQPDLLPWTSAGVHTGRINKDLKWLTDHHDYWVLGNTSFERQARYKSLCEEGLSHSRILDIEAAIHGQWALGSDSFIEKIAPFASRRVLPSKRGRPRKETLLKNN